MVSETEHEAFMALALEQAQKAYDAGEFPVGCVIVEKGHVIASGSRTGTGERMSVKSELDHAEIRALRHIETHGIKFDPDKTILYCTMEPCLMCFAAIILSGIKQIVYAYEDAMGGGTGCDLEALTPLYANSGVQITGGVMRQKSLDLFYNFFNKETNQYWKNSYLEEYTVRQKKE